MSGTLSGGLASPMPVPANQNPQAQSIIQQLGRMSVEQLQQVASANGASQMGQLAQRMLQQRRMSPGLAGMKRGGGIQGLADGGPPSIPYWVRQAERTAVQKPTGLLMSDIGGRTDHIASNPAANSYVIPADVVSGLGEGNSLAGAKVLTQIMGMGPHGTPLPQGLAGARSRFVGLPAPPRSRGGP